MRSNQKAALVAIAIWALFSLIAVGCHYSASPFQESAQDIF